MEAIISALRSAISAGGDYGIWIGILAFIIVLGYGMRNKEDKPPNAPNDNKPIESPKELSEEDKRSSQKETFGCLFLLILALSLTLWFIL